MISYKNLNNHSDRNGLSLRYGDQVLAKIWTSVEFAFTPCTIVGFTKNFVVVKANDSEVTKMRTPNNVVKVKDLKTWKLNF